MYLVNYESIQFKIVARLPGSELDGASVGFWNLQTYVEFELRFIEPDTADECIDHRLVLTGTEATGGEARETDIEIQYDVAPLAADEQTVLTIKSLSVTSNLDQCPRTSVLEYCGYWIDEEHRCEDGFWMEKLDDEYTTTNFDMDVMTVEVTISQKQYLEDMVYSFGHYDG